MQYIHIYVYLFYLPNFDLECLHDPIGSNWAVAMSIRRIYININISIHV